jgi:succinate dehydrogenase/fumarate reductase flavoprotein subunit
MMAACVAGERCATTLITDRGLGTSNSAVAQGGLQMPSAEPGALERFREDIIRSGGSGVDHDRLERFVAEAGPTVDLLTSWGLELDRQPDGRPVRRRAGGMSEPRLVTSGDRIGTSVLRVLRRRLTDVGVSVVLQQRVIDVTRSNDRFRLTFATDAGMNAATLVMAIGGGAFERANVLGAPTSNPANRNTELYDAVRRLGVDEVDPELFQYQPYGIVHPTLGVTGKCVPESIVELGARVVDAQRRPISSPGADRRQLTEAMFAAMESGQTDRVADRPACVLTLSEVDRTVLFARYPHLERALQGAVLPAGDIHVVPVLHYQLGGFVVGPDGETTVPGLFLAGEMAGGLHGHNRLMGNGITEAVVSGRLAGAAAADHVLVERPSITTMGD